MNHFQQFICFHQQTCWQNGSPTHSGQGGCPESLCDSREMPVEMCTCAPGAREAQWPHEGRPPEVAQPCRQGARAGGALQKPRQKINESHISSPSKVKAESLGIPQKMQLKVDVESGKLIIKKSKDGSEDKFYSHKKSKTPCAHQSLVLTCLWNSCPLSSPLRRPALQVCLPQACACAHVCSRFCVCVGVCLSSLPHQDSV